MTTHPQNPKCPHVLASRLKLWLLDLCVWLAEWLGHRLPRDLRLELREDIRKALWGARVLALLLALRRCGPAPNVRHQRAHAARGFRHSQVLESDMRAVCRTLRLRGRTIAAKLAEVRAMFDDLDLWAERVRARLMQVPHAARLVLCWVAAHAVRALAAPGALLADTS